MQSKAKRAKQSRAKQSKQRTQSNASKTKRSKTKLSKAKQAKQTMHKQFNKMDCRGTKCEIPVGEPAAEDGGTGRSGAQPPAFKDIVRIPKAKPCWGIKERVYNKSTIDMVCGNTTLRAENPHVSGALVVTNSQRCRRMANRRC